MSSNLKNMVQSHKISSPTPWDIEWSHLYLWCDNNVFLRLLYAFGLVFCNRVMWLCLNLPNKYLWKLFKIIFNFKWFLKSWNLLHYITCEMVNWCGVVKTCANININVFIFLNVRFAFACVHMVLAFSQVVFVFSFRPYWFQCGNGCLLVKVSTMNVFGECNFLFGYI